MPDQESIDAVAEAWASIDGKLEKYKEDRDTEGGAPFGWLISGLNPWGYYVGYQIEAAELIRRINVRGYGLVKLGNQEG